MPSCIVPHCTNFSCGDDRKKSKFYRNLEKLIKISFHKLPKNENKKNLWLKSLRISEPLPKSAVVCSLHFNEKDFNRTLERIVLRANAVPTYYPLDDDIGDNKENAENVQSEDSAHNATSLSTELLNLNTNLDASLSSMDVQPSKQLKDISNHNTFVGTHSEQDNDISAEEMILDEVTGNFVMTKLNVTKDESDMLLNSSCDENVNVKSMVTCATSMSPEYSRDENEINYLQALIKKRDEKIQMQQKALKNLKRKLVRKEKIIADLQNLIKTMDEKQLLYRNPLDNLQHISRLSKDLLKRIINKDTSTPLNRQYSSEIRSFALTLHYYSPKAYEYVRETFNYCLPDLKTIYRWYRSEDDNPGFNMEDLNSIKENLDAQ